MKAVLMYPIYYCKCFRLIVNRMKFEWKYSDFCYAFFCPLNYAKKCKQYCIKKFQAFYLVTSYLIFL